MKNPDSTRLFHITAIENLPSIVAAGHLLAKNVVAKQGLTYTNIAHDNIQEWRAITKVPVGRAGVLHDYVPFYFAPRSPMLLAIHRGKVDGYTGEQSDIVTLETTASKVIAHDPSGFAFYDMHSKVVFSKAYNDLADLDRIAWDLLTESPALDGFCQYWQNKSEPDRYVQRKEKRQAEFLVHHSVPLSAITGIGVCNVAA